MHVLGDWLYEVSTALLIPVMVLLLVLLAVVLIALGRFAREALERRRGAPARQALRARLLASDARGGPASRWLGDADVPAVGAPLVLRFAREVRAAGAEGPHLEALVADCQIEGSRIVARASWVARAGPVLGLMGTLIPMGPALAQLSQGDMDALARSLVVAFTTTVVGLIVGLAASSIASVRRHWYAGDVALVEHWADCLAEPRR